MDLSNRGALFRSLEDRVFDVVVIGGGITGAGIARDAAQRGLAVALVEMGDFASGTSSRSSKLIHGGLRYLAQGDLGLVREAASERKVLRAIAPALARETPFIVPARSAASLAKLRAGLWTFEKLGGVDRAHRHQSWSPATLTAREPAVATRGIAGAIVYPEYLTDDARLTLANIRTAVADGAVAANYARAERIVIEGGRAMGVEVAETLPRHAERRAILRAGVIVNAAGPWADAVRALESADAHPRLELTRGVHLVVTRERLPLTRTLIMSAPDRRGVFAVPKGQMVYLGTTDVFHEAPEVWPPITGGDVDYLLATAARSFTIPPLTRGDILSAWSGLRPLIAQGGKSPSEISRRDEVWTGPAGVISIAGGKLTAFRAMARRVVDDAEAALGRRPSPCRTAEEPLIGAEAPAPDSPDVAGEAERAVLSEGVLRLEDWWARRSSRAWFAVGGGMDQLETAAEAMAPLLGWDEARRREEVEACRRIRAQDLEAIG